MKSERSTRYLKYLRILPIFSVLGFVLTYILNSGSGYGIFGQTFIWNVDRMVFSGSALVLLIIFLFGLVAVTIADQAHSKNRSWTAFFWLSLLLSPLVTWLIVATIKGEESQAEQSQPSSVSEEIGKLEALYKSGALSEEEFKRAKSKLLGT